MVSNGIIKLVLLLSAALVRSAEALDGAAIVDFDTAPFHLNLRMNSTHICGATLITDSWLLTAAHCVHRVEVSTLTVQAMVAQVASRQVTEVIQHPDYDRFSLNNDLALVRVTPAYNFTTEPVRALQLVEEGYDFAPRTLANLTGYGPASLWPSLRGANASLITQDECDMLYHQTGLTDSMLCAQVEGARLEAGDGGAALVVLARGAGVASHQLLRRPAVFTRLALPRVRSFIQQHAAV